MDSNQFKNKMLSGLKNPLILLELIISLIIPLGGVLFFEWGVFSIVLFYIVETIILWFFEVLKIKMSTLPFGQQTAFGKSQSKHKIIMLITFVVAVFIGVQVALFQGIVSDLLGEEPEYFNEGLLWASGLSFAQQLVYFIQFTVRKNYITMDANKSVTKIIMRIFVQQFTVILGSFVAAMFNVFSPMAAKVALVLVFTAVKFIFNAVDMTRVAETSEQQ